VSLASAPRTLTLTSFMPIARLRLAPVPVVLPAKPDFDR
jgi:hypothetical protein